MLFSQDITLKDTLQNTDLAINLMDEMTRVSLRIKAKDLSAFKKNSGLNLPRNINQSNNAKGILSLRLGPDEWLLIANTKNSKKLHTLCIKMSSEFTFSHTDVSHRNIGLAISGPQAANAINIGCPLDLSLSAFPIGKVTRTVFENASIMLLRTGETEFHIECWRSFGPYICGFFDRFTEDL